ncbi:MAG: hydantoinase/oxoprolinase family protein [Pseudotabrizicola sp.]|uniref:hydantoinase/oxoprolinase family protein n=1 Tax=Pseudotabrizicola sp. TaxID=2939647 RepID=UPI0027312A8F|nr:hydantoinase/oxoprolinase family protein [Pseudotabrizicola sp.]MDP2083062.1 hydantoinase/oxoprolinase family protein [Pseudotabrizicola sp.]MDZ7572480.1 hydantoinase/oxoprolinase family protein [Pseudotabrizicola sp.]
MIRVGVDVGGTFTDLVLERVDSAGQQKVFTHKVSSTVADQSVGVVQGVVELCAIAGVQPGQIDALFHGTTVATNIVIERNGAEVGMITSQGFRDILHMGRHKRPHNFSLQFDVPWQSAPLIKRRNRIAVAERLMPPDGRVDTLLDVDAVERAAELFAQRGLEAVVIGFLYSFVNNDHELRAKEIVRRVMPDAFVCASSEVVNTIREYERFSTAAMNAYIGPRTARYLDNLQRRLREAGVTAFVRIMQSNGGVTTVEQACRNPVGLLLSGPAGGVIGGRWTGEACQQRDIITIDIGGTSADISVIRDGDLTIKNPRDTEVAHMPVLVPMIDIDAIGAGGGSIAYIDSGGAFRVGPRSAGAEPGPACYGKGGTLPTVTDAQVVLGRLDAEHFLGGGLKIDPALSETAIRTHLAEPLGLSVKDAALGVLKIINNTMALAIASNSVARGIDPRNYSLMAFGGAGPLHGVALGEIIAVKNVISPLHPGITAAMGLLVTEPRYEYTQSSLTILQSATPEALAGLNAAYDRLRAEATAQLAADGIAPDGQIFTRIAECRYVGQGFELRVEVPDGPITAESAQDIARRFFAVHRTEYGHAFEDQAVQIVTLRVIGSSRSETLRLPPLEKGGRRNPSEAALYARATTFDDGATIQTTRFDRMKLRAEDVVTGPAVIVQQNSTTIVPPGYQARVMKLGDLVIDRTHQEI